MMLRAAVAPVVAGRRMLAAGAPGITIFNREQKRMQRQRAAREPESTHVDYLRDEIAQRCADRLLDISRRFPVLLDVGASYGHLARYVEDHTADRIIQVEMSEEMLKRDRHIPTPIPTLSVVGDEERLPIRENSVDGAVSCLSLHWVNDIPGALSQICRALKPDSPFIGAMFGGDTLFELRSALQVAQLEREGGISPHVSPFVDIRDMSGLLTRGNFTLTTVDIDQIVVNYPNMFALLDDLQLMGESGADFQRRPVLHRDTLMAAAATYQHAYGNPDGSIPATFVIYHMIGWKPSPTQPKPKPRGSADVSLKFLEQQPTEADYKRVVEQIKEKKS